MIEASALARSATPSASTLNPRLDTLASRFPALPPATIEWLAEGASARTLAASSEIVREDDENQAIHFLVEGWACQFMTIPEGARHLPAILVPGDALNLDTLIFERADHGVRALTRVTMLSITRHHMFSVMAERSDLVGAFLELALLENAILRQRTLCLARLSARERIAHLLCELSVRLDGRDDDASHFPLPLTQEQLGDTLGLTSVHVNRMFRQLHAEGLVSLESRIVTIPSVAALRKAGNFDPDYLRAGRLRAAARTPSSATRRVGPPRSADMAQ